jgi:hypothetical protein
MPVDDGRVVVEVVAPPVVGGTEFAPGAKTVDVAPGATVVGTGAVVVVILFGRVLAVTGSAGT